SLLRLPPAGTGEHLGTALRNVEVVDAGIHDWAIFSLPATLTLEDAHCFEAEPAVSRFQMRYTRAAGGWLLLVLLRPRRAGPAAAGAGTGGPGAAGAGRSGAGGTRAAGADPLAPATPSPVLTPARPRSFLPGLGVVANIGVKSRLSVHGVRSLRYFAQDPVA